MTVIADPARCSFQFNPVGTASFTTSCDVVKSFLARNSVNYRNEPAPAGTVATVDDRRQGRSRASTCTGLPPAEAEAKTDALTEGRRPTPSAPPAIPRARRSGKPNKA